MQDHREVQKLFRKAERMESGDRELQQIVETACAALTQHAEMEEQLFYPAIREASDDEDSIQEALVEHESAKQLIAQLEAIGARDERYKATFKVLGEYVNHHIEEEESTIFRLARRAKLDMEALGEQIMMLKQGGETMSGQGQGEAGERGQRAGSRGSSGSSSSRSRARTRSGESTQASETRESDDEESDAMMSTGRTGGDTSEDTERPGRGGRSARGSVEDADEEEIDVETPGRSSRHDSQ